MYQVLPNNYFYLYYKFIEAQRKGKCDIIIIKKVILHKLFLGKIAYNNLIIGIKVKVKYVL